MVADTCAGLRWRKNVARVQSEDTHRRKFAPEERTGDDAALLAGYEWLDNSFSAEAADIFGIHAQVFLSRLVDEPFGQERRGVWIIPGKKQNTSTRWRMPNRPLRSVVASQRGTLRCKRLIKVILWLAIENERRFSC